MSGIGPFAAGSLEDKVVGVLRTIYDPEIPVDIFEVGLIYDVDADAAGNVAIRMTLTSPMCPVAESLPVEVETKVKALPGVAAVKVEIVWEPPWGPDMMSEAARLELGMM
jgi:FeS assembly SUF system protein